MSDTPKHAICPDGEPWHCKFCGKENVWFTSDETWDGAYDRYHYSCRDCGKQWSVVAETD
jgi:transposase-like protein